MTLHYQMTIFKLVLLAGLSMLAGCRNKPSDTTSTQSASTKTTVSAPAFTADTAYALIERQLAIGARVPNTPAHVEGGDFLIAKLKEYGCAVTVQDFQPTTWDGVKLRARNIIGSINPAATKRILLASHWDSRPRADQDSLVANRAKSVPAANDGASGVAVLLELARTIQQAKTKPNVGVDIIFFDAEDWGSGEKASKDFDPKVGQQVDFVGFCLGSRHWANNPHKPNYSAYYGVLLDMVGAKDATFKREGYSMQFAPTVTTNFWQTASESGYGQFFIDQPGGPITDDHIAPNLILRIPMIDIIDYRTVGFFPDWHTTEDDMRNIDRATLKAVGQTLLQALYNETDAQ
jgi:glutaminyl-peptide cyclotransferase